MRATEEQTGRCSLGKRRAGLIYKLRCPFSSTHSAASRLPHCQRQNGLCVQTLGRVSLTHTVLKIHTETFTWTWVNQSDLRGSFPAALVFIGQWRTKQCGNGQVCIKELFKTLKHPYTAFACLSHFHKREGLGDLFCDFCSPQRNYSQVIIGNNTDYS